MMSLPPRLWSNISKASPYKFVGDENPPTKSLSGGPGEGRFGCRDKRRLCHGASPITGQCECALHAIDQDQIVHPVGTSWQPIAQNDHVYTTFTQAWIAI